MKHLFFICLLALFSIPASGIELPKEIELAGGFNHGKGKTDLLPVEAVNEGNSLSITFFLDLADATVTVTSIEGVVQTRIVSFVNFQPERFDISNYPKGAYTLSVTTSKGVNLHGLFEIE